MVDASSQATKVSAQEREQMDSLQAKGAKTAFMLLDESKQREYVEAAFSELAAFANWRRSQVAQQDKGDLPPATEFEGCWDLLDEEQKLEWVPQDAKAFLAADLQFANLVTTPFGEEAKKAFKGETATKVPVKEETKKSGPGKEVIDQKVAKVKEEPGTKAADPKPPKAVVKHELKPSTAAAEKETSAPQKAVVVKQEPKQIVPAEPKKAPDAAPKEKAKPIQKQEVPKEKVVVKKELKKTDAAQPAKTVKKTEAPKEKAKPVQKQEASKEKAVEVKREPVQTPALQANPQVEKPSSKVKAVETSVVPAEQPEPTKEKAARAKKIKETTSEPAKKPEKAKAKGRVGSLEQRLKKKSRAVEDDEEEQLMALVQRSDDADDADDADVAEAPVKEIAKPRGRKEAPRAPPGRMVVNRQCRGTTKAVAENLFPEALKAICCKCNEGSATPGNDLAMCDRCDKAFHQKCHEPPVAYFGNPEDQWFCAQCTLELAQMRKLNLKVEDFCWVQATGETMSWPARVLRIDFSSLADPKPYWVQFFDSGPPEGAWVGEIHVKPWTEGPSYGSIVQARRRNAVGLAEAAGAEKISTEPRKRTAAGHAENPHRRRRAVAEDLDKARPRRSRRGEVDVPLLTEPTPVRVPAVCAKQVPDTQGMESPQRKRKAQDADPASTEKQRRVDTVDPEAQSKIAETCDLIAELKEQQRQIDEALAQQEIS